MSVPLRCTIENASVVESNSALRLLICSRVAALSAAVEKAGSTEMKAVRRALEGGGICTDGPSGRMCIDPGSHHGSHTIYRVHVRDDHSVEIPKIWNDIQPYWLGDVGCDLSKKDDFSQYTPSNLPKK